MSLWNTIYIPRNMAPFVCESHVRQLFVTNRAVMHLRSPAVHCTIQYCLHLPAFATLTSRIHVDPKPRYNPRSPPLLHIFFVTDQVLGSLLVTSKDNCCRILTRSIGEVMSLDGKIVCLRMVSSQFLCYARRYHPTCTAGQKNIGQIRVRERFCIQKTESYAIDAKDRSVRHSHTQHGRRDPLVQTHETFFGNNAI